QVRRAREARRRRRAGHRLLRRPLRDRGGLARPRRGDGRHQRRRPPRTAPPRRARLVSRGPTVAEAPGVTSADAPTADAPDAATVGGAAGPRIGVLALQGDVREHSRMLEHLGAQVMTVRRPADLAEVDGLVLPGGESTVIDRLAGLTGLRDPLREAIAGGLPVLGTCAGLI